MCFEESLSPASKKVLLKICHSGLTIILFGLISDGKNEYDIFLTLFFVYIDKDPSFSNFK